VLRAFNAPDFLHPFGANSNTKFFAEKAVFISLSDLFCYLTFTDSGHIIISQKAICFMEDYIINL